MYLKMKLTLLPALKSKFSNAEFHGRHMSCNIIGKKKIY